MDLLVLQLKAAIRRLLDEKGISARVLDKVNRHGEVVIGVVLERQAERVDRSVDRECADDDP